MALIAIVFAVVGMSLPQEVTAQYFGQNKVTYENFKFKILKTEHFDVYYYQDDDRAINDAARMAERWYARHSHLLGLQLVGRQPLIVYASSSHFGQTNVVGQVGEGTGGVTEPLKRRVVLPFAGPLKETDHVIGHELVHAFQYSLAGGASGRPAVSGSSLDRLPLWFVEGMAEYLSLGPDDPNTAMWMRDATKTMKKLPTIRQLGYSKYFPYRWGQAALAYIGGKWGDSAVASLLLTASKSGDIRAAIKRVLGVDADTLSQEWHQALHDTYDPIAKVTKSPSDYGKKLIGPKHGGGDLNVGPVLSPDGKSFLFFSERGQFSIDLFLADAETGKVKKTVLKTELDPHFSSLEFINSAGAWNPNGKQVAFSAVVSGKPTLSILDLDRDKVIKEIKLDSLDEIVNPAWSPDGRYIAFSALVGGYSDLYLYDIQTGALKQLTNDAYADLQPAWSPDGTQLAFVTDRFSTDLNDLDEGDYQIGLLQIGSNDVTALHMLEGGKVIDPHWSPDGRSLYVVSDQNGISNIYRYSFDDNSAHQVTSLYTGVSGITSISPCLSVASSANRLVYSAFEDGKYDIYQIENPGSTPDAQPLAVSGEGQGKLNPGALPPTDRKEDQVVALLSDPTLGLPKQTTFPSEPYHSKLSLDYISQPYLAAGTDALGAQLGGGAALFWSDMLGNHNLATAIQLQTDGGFTDFGTIIAYQNSTRRWIWGGAVQQIPYTFVSYGSGLTTVNGSQAYVEQQFSYRQINREVAGLIAYPFNRASRIELSAGYDNIGFEQKVRTQVFDPASGVLLSDQEQKLPSLNSISMASASTAFVYDNAIIGAMSPLLGERFRLEVQPTVGSISLYQLTGDFRRYEMPVRPFTFAFRLLHYGRYGKGAEDERLTPLFLGYKDLVRGYNSGSFDASECQGDTNCPTFNKLFGSKMAVANAELRFPLLGLLHLGSGFYGALPIETGLFYDVGVTWTKDEKPSFINNGPRKPVQSYGALARANILGYLVVEVDYVKPVDRPVKGSYWQFSISPGF